MKNKLDKLRIAIVGCGRISHNHFQSIEQHKNNINLVAVCDIDNLILSNFSKKFNVAGYKTLNDLLKNEKLDIVALCTPSGLHAEQTQLCAKFGVNVITEKPMATKWNDGKKMVSACNEAGVQLFVVKQNRKNPTLQLLKRAIDEDRFGKINMVHINVFWTRPQSYYDQANWRGTWELDGGALMNQASHYIDLLDWLIGPVDKIQAMTSKSRNIEVEDTGVVNIKWKSGTLGSVSVTMLTYPKNLEGSITILGDKGTARLTGVAVNEITIWEFDTVKDYDKDIGNLSYQTKSVYGNGHALYYSNVINCLKGNAVPDTDGNEGLRSLEIIIGAYLSAKEGKIVSLPLDK